MISIALKDKDTLPHGCSPGTGKIVFLEVFSLFVCFHASWDKLSFRVTFFFLNNLEFEK